MLVIQLVVVCSMLVCPIPHGQSKNEAAIDTLHPNMDVIAIICEQLYISKITESRFCYFKWSSGVIGKARMFESFTASTAYPRSMSGTLLDDLKNHTCRMVCMVFYHFNTTTTPI